MDSDRSSAIVAQPASAGRAEQRHTGVRNRYRLAHGFIDRPFREKETRKSDVKRARATAVMRKMKKLIREEPTNEFARAFWHRFFDYPVLPVSGRGNARVSYSHLVFDVSLTMLTRLRIPQTHQPSISRGVSSEENEPFHIPSQYY
jgi:hypothetical protein